MTDRQRNLRALGILVLGVAGLFIWYYTGAPQQTTVTTSSDALELQLARLRRVASTAPAKAQILNDAQAQLAGRERGVLHFSTAAQAGAHLLEVIHRVSAQNKIEARGGDFAQPTILGGNYGQVTAGVSFETTIDAYVNFLADLSREPELIAPFEQHITQGNLRNKTINVRLTVAGIVPRALVPEKKGFTL